MDTLKRYCLRCDNLTYFVKDEATCVKNCTIFTGFIK